MKITIPTSSGLAYQVMTELLSGVYETQDLVSFLQQYQVKPAQPEILTTFLEAIIDQARYVIDTNEYSVPVIDVCGTGGDRQLTVNISTLAGLFAAATGLVKVAKYGNKAATSICGSMDVLEGLGVPIELSEREVSANLVEHGFSPLFARSIYPGAKHVALARSLISGATIFNVLFPLARPIIGSPRFLFGVADERMFETIVSLCQQSPTARGLIVHGLDKTDEVSVTGEGLSNYVLIDCGQRTSGVLDVKEIFGFKPVLLSELQIKSIVEAKKIFKAACNPEVETTQLTAVRTAIFANAALALFVGLEPGNMDVRAASKYLVDLEKSISIWTRHDALTKTANKKRRCCNVIFYRSPSS